VKTVPVVKGLTQRLKLVACSALLLCAFAQRLTGGAEPLTYHLTYDPAAPSLVHISISLGSAAAAPLIFIMPRTIPGGYVQRPYDPFVANVKAYGSGGQSVDVRREEDGPRWRIGKPGDQVHYVAYDVDVKQMEREIFAADESSRIRDGYVGLLGYSLFAFFDGRENEAIRLEISAPASWPVFSTLAPRVPASTGNLATQAANYYELADSQIVLGPKAQLRKIDGDVPLFLSVYAETDEDIATEGALARDALDKVAAYFGKVPFSAYTVMVEYLRPVSARHEYGFSMEHLNSGTFFLGVERALTSHSSEDDKSAQRANYAHHIAHSWIPKRAYGQGYLPFNWEMEPIIDTIWFNEGFGRYVAITALADGMPKDEGERYRQERLRRLRQIVDADPPFIHRMSLTELSQEGSFLYSDDFRTGKSLFSRGALMAAEMDDHIRQQTDGKKSLRDALRHLMDWSERNQRAFRTEELPVVFREATGVDTQSILDRWMQPMH
jgi:predicted metalloprotease with PDZ domain